MDDTVTLSDLREKEKELKTQPIKHQCWNVTPFIYLCKILSCQRVQLYYSILLSSTFPQLRDYKIGLQVAIGFHIWLHLEMTLKKRKPKKWYWHQLYLIFSFPHLNLSLKMAFWGGCWLLCKAEADFISQESRLLCCTFCNYCNVLTSEMFSPPPTSFAAWNG